jgi:hypothetical protein
LRGSEKECGCDQDRLQDLNAGYGREQIEHEILNSRDLSKKNPQLRRLAYAMRTASKAIALSTKIVATGFQARLVEYETHIANALLWPLG